MGSPDAARVRMRLPPAVAASPAGELPPYERLPHPRSEACAAVRRHGRKLFVFGGKEAHAYTGAYHRDPRGDLWGIELGCPERPAQEPAPAAAGAGLAADSKPRGPMTKAVPPKSPLGAGKGRSMGKEPSTPHKDLRPDLPPLERLRARGWRAAEVAQAAESATGASALALLAQPRPKHDPPPPPRPPLALVDLIAALPRSLMPAELAIDATVP